MNGSDLQFVGELARRRLGLQPRALRPFLIEQRLAPCARRDGFADVDTLLEAARAEPDGAAASAVAEAMCSADTAFFRDRQVFARLQRDILPALARRREGGRVRVWSVGCGGGQEVYSLAIGALEAADPGLRLELFASDVSERALHKARAACYTHFEVQRGLPVRQLLRWFVKSGDMWRVSPPVRQMVRWARVNLLDDLSELGPFDVILCRNVLGGFVPELAARTARQLGDILAADGVLVLGRGEPVAPPPGFSGVDGVFERGAGTRREAA